MRKLYFIICIVFSIIFRVLVIYVAGMLALVAMIFSKYAGTVKSQEWGFGSFIDFVQTYFLTFLLGLSVPLFLLALMFGLSYRLSSDRHKAGQGADSCGGK